MSEDGQLMLYQNEQFGELEIWYVDDKPYFPAVECAEKLGYTGARNAVIRHCIHVRKRYVNTSRGEREKKYIPEGDLNRLIMRSNLPDAQKFMSWVCDEILPNIRKRGAYLTPRTLQQVLSDPKNLIVLLQELSNEQEKSKQLAVDNAFLSVKATYCDQILQSNEALQVTKIAKDYGLSAVTFNKLLHDLKIQYQLGRSWILYNQYSGKGYTVQKTYHISEDKTVTHTYFTQRGRMWLYELLKEHGILPKIERYSEQHETME